MSDQGAAIVKAINLCWPNSKYREAEHGWVFAKAVNGLPSRAVETAIKQLPKTDRAHAPTPGQFYNLASGCVGQARASEQTSAPSGKPTPKQAAWKFCQARFAKRIGGLLVRDYDHDLTGSKLDAGQIQGLVDGAKLPQDSRLESHQYAYKALSRTFAEWYG